MNVFQKNCAAPAFFWNLDFWNKHYLNSMWQTLFLVKLCMLINFVSSQTFKIIFGWSFQVGIRSHGKSIMHFHLLMTLLSWPFASRQVQMLPFLSNLSGCTIKNMPCTKLPSVKWMYHIFLVKKVHFLTNKNLVKWKFNSRSRTNHTKKGDCEG